MNFSLVFMYAPVIFRELWAHKFAAFFCFAIVAITVLAAGIFWPVSYKTATTIYADNQNILKPLLAEQAAVTKVQDQARVVQDVIHSPRILRDVVENTHDIDSFESAADMERAVVELRNRLKITRLGSNYIKVSYSDNTDDAAYNTLNAVVDRFIKDSSDNRRIESKEAFVFIDRQVKQYKEQLLAAEERLKEFNSDNFDGRDSDVDSRISTLRSSIEEMKINIDEEASRVMALEQQLKEENRYNAKRYKVDEYRERLKSIQEHINVLLLTYKENYPDVVSLRAQAEEVRKNIRDAEQEKVSGESASSAPQRQGDLTVNPLYEELRGKLAESKVSLNTKVRRLEATKKLLTQEYERRKRIASRQAELAELTRDYNVTKKIYDDMLERKEKARLSMTLNVEGQGVSYKIQEPAEFPLKPSGLRFLHFVLLGPILGFLAPVAIAIAYVLMDQRLRFASLVEASVNAPLLAVVPHIKTPLYQRLARADMVLLCFMAAGFMAAYVGLAFAHRAGMI
ncbi:chain length-determining protein [Dasania sp. GY-MA-18]|uniref:Chain length-determining protein n=1 Tax=Dasania phycosphaerae TaxID=2950436 RepID=A0A9J6RQ28_9GAMM|nr:MULTISPECIES: XrtA system polysaccharide chain length determinant [Dasania]MCR8924102.1 chain length-determining protein [Dasania sp. GY-MA-18]MCZ0866675.1 chain length-determining protein [Dasania phycosphaerae]MCZ0870260.1 chain length-determining protein [Dasania phycosphaerae]